MKFIHLFKQELISFGCCFLFFLFLSFTLNQFLVQEYKENFLKSNAILINELVKKHPELEYDIVEILQSDTNDDSLAVLEKYSFHQLDSLNTISFIKNMETNITRVTFLSFFLSFFIFLLLILFFYFKRHKRIKEINEYLFRVLQNDYQVDLKDYKEDSISTLKIDIVKITNKLRSASEDSLFDKKNLERTLSDISHQLRTPLTSLYVINDALKSKTLPEKKRVEFLNQQKEQLERMEWLIVTLLKMSQIDSGTIVMNDENVCIHDVIKEAMKPILIPIELKNIDINIKIPNRMKVKLDFHWTVEAFVNLIKNAVEHTKEFGKVSISATDNPMFTEILIRDNGVGIKQEDIHHIFERFYKGNTKSESIGIGLNLSKTIIEKQNGTIHVESEYGKGTTFIIRFYKGIV